MAVDLNLFEEYYHTTKILPGTYLSSSKTSHTPWGSDNYILEGDECALVIDSGMTPLNFYEYCKTFTDKPIIGVLNTHSHFDHTGGNGYFPKVFMHPRAEKGAKTPFGTSIEGKVTIEYPLDYEITPVKEGDTIDLGNRVLEIIEIPAHDMGSIAILDKTNRILFSGDELESGWCNIGQGANADPAQTIENHYNNMRKLKARWDEFDCICPAHHGAPLPKDLLNDVLSADRMILAGEQGSTEIPFKNGGGMIKNDDGKIRMFRYGMAHIGFNIDHVYNK